MARAIEPTALFEQMDVPGGDVLCLTPVGHLFGSGNRLGQGKVVVLDLDRLHGKASTVVDLARGAQVDDSRETELGRGPRNRPHRAW